MKNPEKFLSGSALLTACLLLGACGEQSGTGRVKIPEAPDAAVQTVAHEIGGGNTGILWQAMPAGYQSDLNGVARLAGTKFDPEIYNKSFALIGRIGEVASKQKTFVLNNRFLAGQPEAQKARLEAALPALTGLLETITQSGIASVEGLQSFSGQEFFDTTVSKITDNLVQLSKLSEEEAPTMADLKELNVSVVESADGSATLKMEIPGSEPQTEVFTQVEGRWVPQDMAAGWTSSMAKAKARLEAMSPEQTAAKKPQIMGVLTMFDGVLTQLETAETQEQFDQALQGAMMPMMGLMMMGQGGGGGGAGAPQMPPAPQLPPAPTNPAP